MNFKGDGAMGTTALRRTWKAALPLIFCTLLISCVTIHIYFPAEEVQRTAEEIVTDVRQVPPQSQVPLRGTTVLSSLFRHVDLKLGPARAHAQRETTVSNAAIRSLRDRMRNRNPQLVPFFNEEAIGENNRGYVEILDTSGLDLRARANLNRLVDAENTDRRQLYQEVARALNIDPGQISRIQTIFAEEWQKSAEPGWFIQKADGSWVRK